MTEEVPPVARLLQQLIRVPSPNPPGDCRAIAELCCQLLEAAGFATQMVAPDERAWSVIGTLGNDDGPTLLYHAHIDTVPLGHNARWTHDPFAAEIVDGRIYGLGSIDDKASLAAMLQAGQDLRRDTLRGRLIIVCAADEEVGGRLGTRWLADNGYLPPADFIVVGEQTHNRVAIANKGVLRACFHTAGRTAHATNPRAGVNAINGMAHLIADLERYQEDVLDHRTYPLLGAPSINVGRIEGGVSANVVADACHIWVDRRMVPPEDPQAVIAELQALAAERQARASNLAVTVDSFQISNWFQAPVDDPLTQLLLRLSAEELSVPPEPVGYLPGSDAKHLVGLARHGIVVFGPGSYTVAHATDEYTEIAELVAASTILHRFAAQVLLG